MAQGDVSGPGDTTGDALHGGPGDDTLRTRDGEADRIDCGPGPDDARLDPADVIVDATPANPNGSCEGRARGAQPGGPRSEDATEAPAQERRAS